MGSSVLTNVAPWCRMSVLGEIGCVGNAEMGSFSSVSCGS